MDLSVPRIRFEHITVNLLDDNAGIFVGHNRQHRWSTTANGCKQGFGTVSGNNNAIAYNKQLVMSGDADDSAKHDPEKLEKLRKLMEKLAKKRNQMP